MSGVPELTDWALVILALLNERPMHPYEMRRLVRERGKGEHLDLRPGSLYRTIERLHREGLVEPVETSRAGRFPERTVYEITEHGRDELEEWLREVLSTPRKDLPDLVGALEFLPTLADTDVRAQLEARVVRLEAEVAGYDAAMRSIADSLPRLFLLETEYARAMRAAELEWVRALLADLRAGALSWNREQMRAVGATSTEEAE